MIKAVICLGLNANVKYVVTLGFGMAAASTATPHRLMLMGVGH
jgi:hypothetical protein